MEAKVKVFKYFAEIDAFTVTDEFRSISEALNLGEWHHAVWIGRLFTMDNDLGEHWFDNWDEREILADEIHALGLDESEVFVINPEKFMDGRDGPCNTSETRKLFWTDVLQSLELSFELLFSKARQFNEWAKLNDQEDHIEDLEDRIVKIRLGL